mmetsp:Transcript_58546/g.174340  ORF Transcript_58546/g.174340 Transcript_58546/m.174340 type:complete len:88 (+) Transcript_58546:1448-1711(+)
MGKAPRAHVEHACIMDQGVAPVNPGHLPVSKVCPGRGEEGTPGLIHKAILALASGGGSGDLGLIDKEQVVDVASEELLIRVSAEMMG